MIHCHGDTILNPHSISVVTGSRKRFRQFDSCRTCCSSVVFRCADGRSAAQCGIVSTGSRHCHCRETHSAWDTCVVSRRSATPVTPDRGPGTVETVSVQCALESQCVSAHRRIDHVHTIVDEYQFATRFRWFEHTHVAQRARCTWFQYNTLQRRAGYRRDGNGTSHHIHVTLTLNGAMNTFQKCRMTRIHCAHKLIYTITVRGAVFLLSRRRHQCQC